MPTLALQWQTPAGPVTRPIPVAAPLTLGRDPACDIAFDDATVSRRHCAFFIQDGVTYLRHLSATNATYVNGRIALGDTIIAAGDVLTLPVIEVRVIVAEPPGIELSH